MADRRARVYETLHEMSVHVCVLVCVCQWHVNILLNDIKLSLSA